MIARLLHGSLVCSFVRRTSSGRQNGIRSSLIHTFSPELQLAQAHVGTVCCNVTLQRNTDTCPSVSLLFSTSTRWTSITVVRMDCDRCSFLAVQLAWFATSTGSPYTPETCFNGTILLRRPLKNRQPDGGPSTASRSDRPVVLWLGS